MTTTPKKPSTASVLAATLRDRGYRAEVLPADPPNTLADAVDVWHDPLDRYPATSVWEPYEVAGCEWGPNFEHTAPAKITIAELADRVLATLKPRACSRKV
jgi:hypothetical protein